MSDQPLLDKASLPAEPLQLFAAWLGDAEASGMTDPNAMTLATAGADGRPSARTMLLRGADNAGFRFYGNTGSLKGRQLAENPRAQLLFYWRELGRQVLIHGAVSELSEAESDAYFDSRPRQSQIGAWSSDQGSVIADRAELLARVEQNAARFEDEPVPRPPHWGGYLVEPQVIEFWQLAEFRLHDRFVYSRGDDQSWTIERLAP